MAAGIPCVIDDVVEITSEAQIFSLPLLAQVGDGGDDDPVPSLGAANQSKKPATLRAEVTQASAAMAVATKVRADSAMASLQCLHDVLPRSVYLLCVLLQDDLVEGTGVERPSVPDEVEWVPKDVDAMTLEELKEQAAKQRR